MAANRQGTRNWIETMQALRHSASAEHYRRNDHSRRVADLAETVARSMGLPDDEVHCIRRGALLHDVGNVGVPEEILLKPGPLTDDELSHIREHVDRGVRDFEALDVLQEAIPIVRHHHERVDGSGYPDRLRGEEIPIGARVVAAADAYVMMTAELPWRAARSHEQAICELQSVAGSHLDERVVDCLVTILRRRDDDV